MKKAEETNLSLNQRNKKKHNEEIRQHITEPCCIQQYIYLDFRNLKL